MRNSWGDVVSLYYGLDGNPIERTPDSHHYSYDEFVVYKSEDFKPTDSMVYHDRMIQWDRKAFEDAVREVWPGKAGSQAFFKRTPADINRFLNLYFKKEVKLTAVLQGCNVSTGYPYWVFGYVEL